MSQPVFDEEVFGSEAAAADPEPDVASTPLSAQVVNDRMIVGHATGMLMLVYGLDSEDARELLNWGAQAGDAAVGAFAQQLAADLVARVGELAGVDGCRPVDLRSACDDVLFDAYDPNVPGSRMPR
jgi:hypothetical protein